MPLTAMCALTAGRVMFVKPRDPSYAGKIIGENSRRKDMGVNVVKDK